MNLIALIILIPNVAPPSRVVPLPQAHAHNDYAHRRPLHDALDHGFTSVEADIFRVGTELLVGHFRLELRPDRTLQRLYLDPLRRRVRENGGTVYPGSKLPFYLLIDLKTEGKSTYDILDKLLAEYGDMLSHFREGRFFPGAVTVVISGNTPREIIAKQNLRYAAIDGRPGDLDSDEPSHLIPMISSSWGSLFRWRGEGAMPGLERDKLRAYVDKTHKRGRIVRFWATPEKPELWRELRSAGVDLINTDQLPRLRDFLLGESGDTIAR